MFPDQSKFSLIPLRYLARSYLGEECDRIGMAGFQRSAVWRESRVEDLWDSLLCRFPIGSILVASYHDFSDVEYKKVQINRSAAYPDILVDEAGVDYIVVDGQQRLNAIALGFLSFSSDAPARLWINLNGPVNPKVRLFDFHLCTRDNPFGRDLEKEAVREAMVSIQKEGFDDSELHLNETYPYRGRLAVPFFEFCQVVQETSDGGTIRSWLMDAGFVNLTGPAFTQVRSNLEKKADPPAYFERLVQAIHFVVIADRYFLPAILIQKEGNLITPERLGKLFERVNINGEVPPQAELFFSALKLRSPQINNYVSEIYKDPVIGRILRSVDLLLIALRMINPDITELRLDQFERYSRDYHSQLLALMESGVGQHSLFHECIRLAYRVLHHNGQPGDIGLPRQLIAGLRPRIWQTLAWWACQNIDSIRAHGISPDIRLDWIRYAILDAMNYFVSNPRSGQLNPRAYTNTHDFDAIPIRSIRSLGNFSIQAIWQAIQEKVDRESRQARIQPPAEFAGWIRPHEAPDRPNYTGLSAEHILLQFAQRDAMQQWEGMDLDIDHIVPGVWFNFRAGKYGIDSFWKVAGVEYWLRHQIMNSIGNKRYLPEALNHSNKDTPPERKYIECDIGQLVDELHRHYGFGVAGDILAPSAINPMDAGEWVGLSHLRDSRIWDTERFRRFKTVVDQRRITMYAELFYTINLEQLTDRNITEIIGS